jgi:hypothetical protein
MAGEILIRKLSLSGWTFDTDWTDPANTPPDNARRLRFTSPTVQFALVGKDGTGGAALDVDVGTLTVDAWLGVEVGTQVRREASLVEATGSELSSRIRIISTDVIPGTIGRLNIKNLTNVGALPALWIYLLHGARPL